MGGLNLNNGKMTAVPSNTIPRKIQASFTCTNPSVLMFTSYGALSKTLGCMERERKQILLLAVGEPERERGTWVIHVLGGNEAWPASYEGEDVS